MLGLARAMPHCRPTHLIRSCAWWNYKHSQSEELIQSLTLEALPLKTKINSAIESIGHINTSIVSDFIRDILRDVWKFFIVWHCPHQPERDWMKGGMRSAHHLIRTSVCGRRGHSNFFFYTSMDAHLRGNHKYEGQARLR